MHLDLGHQCYTSFDFDQHGLLIWENVTQPDVVIIALHGINGSATDYEGFASQLTSSLPSLAIYAPQTRGQGNDGISQRRGDIYRARDWFRDLETLHTLIQEKHPKASIFWCGESLGSLIVANTAAQSSLRPKGIILLSPVVKIARQIPCWKISLARFIASLAPNIRIPFQLLSGSQNVKVTQGAADHHAQAITNPYHIEKVSLRLLLTIADLIESMPSCARKMHTPTYVAYAGNDFFTPSDYTTEWLKGFPSSTITSSFWPDSYHLMLYDARREAVFADITRWISAHCPAV